MTKFEHPLSWNALFRVVIVILICVLTYRLMSTLLLILVSLMLATALYPSVMWLHKRMVPLSLAAVLVVLLILLPIVLLCYLIIPPLYSQYPSLVDTLSHVIKESSNLPAAVKEIDINEYSRNLGHYLLNSTSVVTNIIYVFITIVFLTLYLLIDSERLKEIFLKVFPEHEREKINLLLSDLSKINGQYIRGNLFISLICGSTTYIALKILGVPYAAPLALFSAIFDLLPVVGAFIGAAPAIFIGFSISPTVGILVLIIHIVYQQIENNIISPEVYDKALDISPALSFMAFILGTELLGLVGAFISLPIAAAIPTLVQYIHSYRQKDPAT